MTLSSSSASLALKAKEDETTVRQAELPGLEQDSSNVIRIAGIFDMTNIDWLEELFDFIINAIQNQDEWLQELIPSLVDISLSLSNTEIVYNIRNADCDATTAVRAYWDLRSKHVTQLPPHGVVGAYCSGATISLAQIAGLEEVTVLSPFSTSSQLSNSEEFPYFARMLAPDNGNGEVGALVATLRLYGWNRVSILATDTPFAKDWAKEFRGLWEGEHDGGTAGGGAWTGEISYSNTIRFRDGTIDEESVKQGLREVPTDSPETNSRIILLAAHPQDAFPILEIADSIGFQPDTCLMIRIQSQEISYQVGKLQ